MTDKTSNHKRHVRLDTIGCRECERITDERIAKAELEVPHRDDGQCHDECWAAAVAEWESGVR